ncbi:MAG TPA: ATP-binding protein [Bryobacteraceae bacterium]|nr:ATP-binding protein [Bryobacteraceae bacterium]
MFTRSKRLLYGLGAILLIVSVVLVVWQGSFAGSFGSFEPKDATETFVFFGISILIFLLMMTLSFWLVRLVVKLWIERRSDRAGSRIRTKLVFGALALSLMPVLFMVLFSVYVLNNTMQRWLTLPARHELMDFDKIKRALERQTLDKALAEADLLASTPAGKIDAAWLRTFCESRGIVAARVGDVQYGKFPPPQDPKGVTVDRGTFKLAVAVPIDVAQQEEAIGEYHRAFGQMSSQRRGIWTNYLLLLSLIALFVLVVATWLAQYLARQISAPISALLQAAEEVSRGNLAHRVQVTAVDELAQLVGGFNRMTADLQANRAELEARRRFTEAILESIPTGVISVDSAGAIQRVNKALDGIFPELKSRNAVRLDDLFSREDTAEIRYLMNRARRTGRATRQLEMKTPRRTLHLAVTVSAIEGGRGAGFVIVIEDTSDLLRAQKIAAWSEVARRVAHEIKNPLTPITLSAERIIRQINRAALPEPLDPLFRECAETILLETASVKRLVDEFWQFSRLPAAQPALCDLNEVVSSGIGVFADRLEGIDLHVDLAPGLPPVFIDPEQIKRVVVNLVDNAAEAMQDVPTKVLVVQTRAGAADNIELIVADTGCGITPEQKEKLFLPYFSTKSRGTGLGLAIVSHILTEHNATIRVEDNEPCGAWFAVEIPAAASDKATAEKAIVSAVTAGVTISA